MTAFPPEHPGARQAQLGEAFRRAAKISGIDLQGINAQVLGAELEAAGLLLTPEREAELRQEGREAAARDIEAEAAEEFYVGFYARIAREGIAE